MSAYIFLTGGLFFAATDARASTIGAGEENGSLRYIFENYRIRH